MKKYIVILTIVMMVAACLAGCGDKDIQTENNSEKLSIVTTIFPVYDWVLNVLGDNPSAADVAMLMDSGADMHSYQPTAEDIVKISNCDLLVYVGGESDEWVEDVLEEAENKNLVAINLLDVLGDAAKEEELVEGMQEETHDHDHDGDVDHDHDSDAEHDEDTDHDENMEHDEHDEDSDHDEHDHGDEAELDEHVWLSLKNASELVMKISEAIQSIDAANADVYAKNTDAYIEKINTLDSEYESVVSAASSKTLLFGDRFPFRYMVDDYDIDYYAAFAGCSSETEASFDTIMFLSNKVDELSLKSVMTIEGAEHKIAEAIIKNTKENNQKILMLDSMQSKMSKDIDSGVSYLSVMEENLAVLREALS